jgi:glycosyl transferase family 87
VGGIRASGAGRDPIEDRIPVDPVPGRARVPLALLMTCALMLGAGFLLKSRCSSVPWDGRHYGALCYNDIQALYGARGLDRDVFPYLQGSLRDGELRGGAIEYPVLSGLLMWVGSRFASDFRSFLPATALLLAPFALAVAAWLWALSGPRAYLWAAAPALVLYAFHNWDLPAVACSVVALWLWTRARPGLAAAALGAGAAVKLYPALFLPALVIERLVRGDRRGAAAAAGAGVGVFAAVNLPFALANFSGWWATYAFHARRVADYNSFYLWGFRPLALDPDRLNLVVAAATALSGVVAVAWGLRRARSEGRFPLVAVSAASLAAFMLWSKVHSPQYALWIIPFFCLLRVHAGWWVAYTLADLAVYVGIFRWFYDFSLSGDAEVWTPAKILLVSGVWVRAGLLFILFFIFSTAKSAWEVAPVTETPSQGRSTVTRDTQAAR